MAFQAIRCVCHRLWYPGTFRSSVGRMLEVAVTFLGQTSVCSRCMAEEGSADGRCDLWVLRYAFGLRSSGESIFFLSVFFKQVNQWKTFWLGDTCLLYKVRSSPSQPCSPATLRPPWRLRRNRFFFPRVVWTWARGLYSPVETQLPVHYSHCSAPCSLPLTSLVDHLISDK